MVSLRLTQGLLNFIAWETVLKNSWSMLGPESFVVWMVISGEPSCKGCFLTFPFLFASAHIYMTHTELGRECFDNLPLM